MCVFCHSISRCPEPKYEKASLEKIHADLRQWSNVRQYIYFLLYVCVFFIMVVDVVYLMYLTFIIRLMALISDSNCHHVFDLSQIESHHLITSSLIVIITCHIWSVSFVSCCHLSAVVSLSSHLSHICPPLMSTTDHSLLISVICLKIFSWSEWMN